MGLQSPTRLSDFHFHFSQYGGGLVAQSCLMLVTPWTVACQAPLSMGISRQEYWLLFKYAGKFLADSLELKEASFFFQINLIFIEG